MKGNIKIQYIRTPYRYDVFIDNKKIKKNSTINFTDNGKLLLVERNFFLSKAWFIVAFLSLIFVIFSSGYADWKDTRSKQKFITLSYGKVLTDNILITVSGASSDIKMQNVDSYHILDIQQIHNDKIAKRIKIAQGMLVVVPLLLIATIFVILAVTLWK